jgi:hypothetical protein
MYEIWSDEIVATQNPLHTVEYSKTRESESKAHICGECHSFLWSGSKESQRSKKLDDDEANPRNKHQLDWKYIRKGDRCEWKYIWPAFYWNLLTGVDVRYNTMFCETYPAEHLWKMVPDGIRRSSLSKVEKYNGVVGDDCEETQSHFKDITRSVDGFWSNIRKYTLEGMMKALDPERAATGSDDDTWYYQMYFVHGVVVNFLFVQPLLIQRCYYSIIFPKFSSTSLWLYFVSCIQWGVHNLTTSGNQTNHQTTYY